MDEFYRIEPSLENYWRAIILFGRNVASYKFALAKSLYELTNRDSDLVSLEELAAPFSSYVCEHLKQSPKQSTSASSKFLDACKEFNDGDLSQDALVGVTIKLGFKNVIDAFHVVNGEDVSKRFFVDERKESGGIRITSEFFELGKSSSFDCFSLETEARWRLVEEAWRLGISRHLISVKYDESAEILFTETNHHRIDVTSCRDSLNGYQKGRCFYCFRDVSISQNDDSLADIDHFFPWMLSDTMTNLNGVWNLVLACRECNRGEGGKFARIPSRLLLQRLHRRNEYFIGSHLPLRETLIQQTGRDQNSRRTFLQRQYWAALNRLIHEWSPEIIGEPCF